MDNIREEFEVWARGEGHRVGCADGDYLSEQTKILFHAWQASRSALCVELPAGDSYMFDDDIKSALEDAGVPYK